MFWPIDNLNKRLDSNGKPHLIQSYNVPEPQVNEFYLHDSSLLSIWNHFVDFCQHNSQGTDEYASPRSMINRFTGNSRLRCFVKLSQSSVLSIPISKNESLCKPSRFITANCSDTNTTIESSLDSLDDTFSIEVYLPFCEDCS